MASCLLTQLTSASVCASGRDDRRGSYACLRYDGSNGYDDEKIRITLKSTRSKCQMMMMRRRRRSLVVLGSASSSSSSSSSSASDAASSPRGQFYQQVIKAARQKFTREISFQSKDKDINLAKALLYIAAEDEALMAFNREIDALAFNKERNGASGPHTPQEQVWNNVEGMPLAGKTIDEWQDELDAIAKEVEAELVSKDIGCDLAQVLEAVNVVLFESRGFRRSPILGDARNSYLHLVLSSGSGIAFMLSIIYIEVCRRLNLTIVGSRVGEEFLIWPQTGNPEELFKVTSGQSLFAIANGRCVDDPKSKASDLTSNSLSGLEIATNRDIIGIALANLIRLHWKHASRSTHGLMLTSPLYRSSDLKAPLLRPQELRLAILAAERLLILQPHNWVLRRDHGMMLYYNREYGKAVQELSICMAFAPEEEAEVLEPFVEMLHLLRRLESSSKSLEPSGQMKVT